MTGLCVLTRVSCSLLSGLVSVSALGDFKPADLVVNLVVWNLVVGTLLWGTLLCDPHVPDFLTASMAQEGFYVIDTYFLP